MALRVALYLAAIASTLLIAPRVPVYWDTFGYVTQALTGDVGGLGFGRPVFVLVSHIIARAWLVAGGSAWDVEIVLRISWMLVSAATAPLTWRLARTCGLSDRAALFAGLAVACSPAMAHAGGAVLTDGPAAMLFVLSCLCGVRGVRASDAHAIVRWSSAAGVVAGLAVGVREQSVLNAGVLALLVLAAPAGNRGRAARAMACAFALAIAAPIVFVLLTRPGYVSTLQTWIVGMRHDRALKTYGWHDLAVFAGWILSLGPAVVVAAAIALARRDSPAWRLGSVLFALIVPSLVQIVAMGAFIGIGYSPRFLLSAFPVAIAMPAAMWLDVWMRESRVRFATGVAIVALPALVAAPIVRQRGAPLEMTMREWPARLIANAPPTSVIVSGQPCAAVPLVREMIATDARRSGVTRRFVGQGFQPWQSGPVPDWQPLCPGWGWPTDLEARLNTARGEGRPVVLDLRPGSWVGLEQESARRDVARYVETLSVSGPPVIVWR